MVDLNWTSGTYSRPSTTCLWRKSFHICSFGYLELRVWGMFRGYVGVNLRKVCAILSGNHIRGPTWIFFTTWTLVCKRVSFESFCKSLETSWNQYHILIQYIHSIQVFKMRVERIRKSDNPFFCQVYIRTGGDIEIWDGEATLLSIFHCQWIRFWMLCFHRL